MLVTLSFEHSLISLNHCASTLWKLNPHKLVGHTLISSNERVSARESVEKWVLLAFLLKIILIMSLCFCLYTFEDFFCHRLEEQVSLEKRRTSFFFFC